MSYGVTGQLLADVLPLDKPINPAVLSRQVERIAERSDSELGPARIVYWLERVKWNLWHGNALRALAVLEDIQASLDGVAPEESTGQKPRKAVKGFSGYIAANGEFIVNNGERYRCGATISTAFVEGRVNELISRRMVKKQPMRWTKAGAHRLLQLRVQVLDGELRRDYERWYPGLRIDEVATQAAA